MLGLVGPSGCGKSTLLELIAGLQEPGGGRGRGRRRQRRAPAASRRCAFMPQRDLLLPWLAAIDNAALALRNRGVRRRAAREEAALLFERFGLAGFERSRPAELSGGMRQRVAFLRTLLAGKPVLALDEPFASLDAITRAEMQAWLAGALRGRPAHRRPRHPRRRGGALPLRSRRRCSRRDRRGVVEELSAPAPRAADRDAAVTDPAFVAVRERAMRALRGGAAVKRWGLPLLVLAALIGAWQVAASTGALADLLNLESFLVPSPAEIASSLWDNRGLLAENAWVTLQEILLGFLCGLVAGARLRRPAQPLGDPAPRLLPAAGRLAGDPDSGRSRRSSSSGSASGSAPSW